MADLSDFGGGITDNDAETDGQADEPGDDEFDYERCRAISETTGERCENPRHRMSASQLCAPHDRAAAVTTVDDREGS
jgi:hypothetical protein